MSKPRKTQYIEKDSFGDSVTVAVIGDTHMNRPYAPNGKGSGRFDTRYGNGFVRGTESLPHVVDHVVLLGDFADAGRTPSDDILKTVNDGSGLEPSLRYNTEKYLDQLIRSKPTTQFHYVIGNHDGGNAVKYLLNPPVGDKKEDAVNLEYIQMLDRLHQKHPNFTYSDTLEMGNALMLHGHGFIETIGMDKENRGGYVVAGKDRLVNASGEQDLAYKMCESVPIIHDFIKEQTAGIAPGEQRDLYIFFAHTHRAFDEVVALPVDTQQGKASVNIHITNIGCLVPNKRKTNFKLVHLQDNAVEKVEPLNLDKIRHRKTYQERKKEIIQLCGFERELHPNYIDAVRVLNEDSDMGLNGFQRKVATLMMTALSKGDRFAGTPYIGPEKGENAAKHSAHAVLKWYQLFEQSGALEIDPERAEKLRRQGALATLVHDWGEVLGEASTVDNPSHKGQSAEHRGKEETEICTFVLHMAAHAVEQDTPDAIEAFHQEVERLKQVADVKKHQYTKVLSEIREIKLPELTEKHSENIKELLHHLDFAEDESKKRSDRFKFRRLLIKNVEHLEGTRHLKKWANRVQGTHEKVDARGTFDFQIDELCSFIGALPPTHKLEAIRAINAVLETSFTLSTLEKDKAAVAEAISDIYHGKVDKVKVLLESIQGDKGHLSNDNPLKHYASHRKLVSTDFGPPFIELARTNLHPRDPVQVVDKNAIPPRVNDKLTIDSSAASRSFSYNEKELGDLWKLAGDDPLLRALARQQSINVYKTMVEFLDDRPPIFRVAVKMSDDEKEQLRDKIGIGRKKIHAGDPSESYASLYKEHKDKLKEAAGVSTILPVETRDRIKRLYKTAIRLMEDDTFHPLPKEVLLGLDSEKIFASTDTEMPGHKELLREALISTPRTRRPKGYIWGHRAMQTPEDDSPQRI